MPAPRFLGQRYRAVFAYTGLILGFGGAAIASPLLVLIAFPGEAEHALSFAVTAAGLGGAGLACWWLLRSPPLSPLRLQDGGVIVLLSWVLVCACSALPLMAILDLGFTQAIFESVSGWTTTGLSVVDVTRAPRIVLVWRSVMQLLGGAGLAVLTLAAMTGAPGVGLAAAEGRTDQLAAHVRRSIRLVVWIYAGYAVAGVLGYRLAGMEWFDAVNHAFAAVSTGGFSTRPESIGYWNSVAVEAVSIPLMILGNLSFLAAYALLQGRWRTLTRHAELRVMAAYLALAVPLILWLSQALYPALGKRLRVAVFETVTAITTTGFSSTGYGEWSDLAWWILILAMIIGGGSGSTAGGLKQLRAYLLAQAVWFEVKRGLLPARAIVTPSFWVGDSRRFLEDAALRRIASFAALYLAFLASGTGVLCAYGYSLRESLFEYASSLGTVGLSVGVTGIATPDPVLWTQIAGMLLGRLEFFVIFVSVVRLAQDAVAAIRR